jgi:hypothetical protein
MEFFFWLSGFGSKTRCNAFRLNNFISFYVINTKLLRAAVVNINIEKDFLHFLYKISTLNPDFTLKTSSDCIFRIYFSNKIFERKDIQCLTLWE